MSFVAGAGMYLLCMLVLLSSTISAAITTYRKGSRERV